MEKFKFLLTITFITIMIFGCNDQPDITPLEPTFVEISIPEVYKSSEIDLKSAEIDDMIIDVQMTAADGKDIIGKIHFIMPEDGTLSYFAMTANLLDETGLTADYWIDAIAANSGARTAQVAGGCFAACRKLEKGKGRGSCKAECWLDVAVKVATIASVIHILDN